MFFCNVIEQKLKAFSKMFTLGCICLPECRPNGNGRGGKDIVLNDSPLGGRTPLPARDSVSLHLTFHSILPFFILLTISSWFGEAADVLTPGDLTTFEGIGLLVMKSNF